MLIDELRAYIEFAISLSCGPLVLVVPLPPCRSGPASQLEPRRRAGDRHVCGELSASGQCAPCKAREPALSRGRPLRDAPLLPRRGPACQLEPPSLPGDRPATRKTSLSIDNRVSTGRELHGNLAWYISF